MKDLPAAWSDRNEGGDTWSAKVVLGHFVVGEETNWIPRTRHILEHGESKPFEPFDRFAQLTRPARRMNELLTEFDSLRGASLRNLRALDLTTDRLQLRGRHPKLGVVTLGQLLSTWVAHDCDHVAQIARVFSGRYREDVGPWRQFLRILGGTQ